MNNKRRGGRCFVGITPRNTLVPLPLFIVRNEYQFIYPVIGNHCGRVEQAGCGRLDKQSLLVVCDVMLPTCAIRWIKPPYLVARRDFNMSILVGSRFDFIGQVWIKFELHQPGVIIRMARLCQLCVPRTPGTRAPRRIHAEALCRPRGAGNKQSGEDRNDHKRYSARKSLHAKLPKFVKKRVKYQSGFSRFDGARPDIRARMFSVNDAQQNLT